MYVPLHVYVHVYVSVRVCTCVCVHLACDVCTVADLPVLIAVHFNSLPLSQF